MKPSYLFLDIDGVLNCYFDSEQLFLSEIEKKSNPKFKIYKSADFVSRNKLRLLQEIVTQKQVAKLLGFQVGSIHVEIQKILENSLT